MLGFRFEAFGLVAVAAGGRDEETNRITQTREGRSKVKIVSEPQVATAAILVRESCR
jgi:hypothetical protein